MTNIMIQSQITTAKVDTNKELLEKVQADEQMTPIFQSAIAFGMEEGFLLALSCFVAPATVMLTAMTAKMRAINLIEKEVSERYESNEEFRTMIDEAGYGEEVRKFVKNKNQEPDLSNIPPVANRPTPTGNYQA